MLLFLKCRKTLRRVDELWMWEEYPIVLPPSLLQHLASIGFTAEDLGGCFHLPPRVEDLRELTFDRCAMCTCARSSSACVCLCKPLCCTRIVIGLPPQRLFSFPGLSMLYL